MDITVSSMRLDGIASDAYRISRTKIVVPIKAGRCRVNWKVEEDPSTNLKEGDVVSIQGFGRFKVLETGSLTKRAVPYQGWEICLTFEGIAVFVE